MEEGEGVGKMMGEGDGEEKDTALLLNSMVKGGRGLGCSTAAAATSLPATAVAGGLITSAAVTASPAEALSTAAGIATTTLATLLAAARGAVPMSSTGDSAEETAATGVKASAAARARAPLGRLARFTVRDWSSDGGDLATAA